MLNLLSPPPQAQTLVNSFSITTPKTPGAAASDEEVIGNLLDPTAALFNHSCEPNCVMEFVGREMVAYTARDLKEGEEATVSYADVEGVDVAQRMMELKERWFFECACVRCLRELGSLGSLGGLDSLGGLQSSSSRDVVGSSGGFGE